MVFLYKAASMSARIFFRSQKTINSPSNRIARYKTTNHQLIIFDQSVIQYISACNLIFVAGFIVVILLELEYGQF